MTHTVLKKIIKKTDLLCRVISIVCLEDCCAVLLYKNILWIHAIVSSPN